jgi:hypothetical protein
VNPIKLREYLAAGLPVVSTPLPEVKLYDKLVRLAEGPDAFETACAAALETDPAGRTALHKAMASETWPAKVERIEDRMGAKRPATVGVAP